MNNTTSLAHEVSRWIGDILHKPIDSTKLDADLVNDYHADSMDMVDIVDTMERKYGVIVTNDEVSSVRTIEDVVSRIQRRREKA